MRDPLRAIKRQLENRFESQRWQSSEKTEKLLAAGAAMLSIVVIGGALFFKKGGKVASAYEGLIASGTKIVNMRAELSALQTRAASLQTEADDGKTNGDKVRDLRAELDAVKKKLELESATLANQTLAITNHVSEAAHQESNRAMLLKRVGTATAGQTAAQRASTELTEKLSEKETEIRGLNEHVAKMDAAVESAASRLEEVRRLTSVNTRLLAETQTANRERTKALEEKAKADETLRDALARLAAAEARGVRLGVAMAGFEELLFSYDAANDALKVAKAQIDELRKLNIDLLKTASEVESTKAALRLAELANERLEGNIVLIETRNKEMHRAAEDSESELVALRGVNAQVEAMRESVDSFSMSASKAINRASKVELQKHGETLRADIAEQSGAVMSSVMEKLAIVVAVQEHSAIEKLQHHLSVISHFSSVYEGVLGRLRDTEGELGKAQADAMVSKVLAERLAGQLISTDERVAAHAHQLLLANANQETAVCIAESRAAAAGNALVRSTDRGNARLTKQYDKQINDLKQQYDATIVSLKNDIAINEGMRAASEKRELELTEEKARALGRVQELDASVKRLTDEITGVRAENTRLLFDLTITDAEVTNMHTQNTKVITDALSAKGSLLIEVANTRATAGSEMAKLDVLTNSFFAILVALSAFTEGAKGLAGQEARATADEAARLFSEFQRAFDAATLVLPRVVGPNSMESIRDVIGESARLTSEAAVSLASAIGERDVAIGERDAANASARLHHASLVEEMRTREVARGERDLATRHREEAQNELRRVADARDKLAGEGLKMELERDAARGERDVATRQREEAQNAASDAFRGVILRHFDPSQIVLMLDSKTGNGAGATVDEAVGIDDTAKTATGAVALLGSPDLIWLFSALTAHWATTLQERVDQKVRSVCSAIGIECRPIPRALTAAGLVELREWFHEFESNVSGFVQGIRSSLPDVVSVDKANKRRREDGPSPPVNTPLVRSDITMITEFGAIQTRREVSHFDFLGAFLSVQRMLITCAAIEAGLIGIEATSAMTPARFGRRMRRSYV